MASPTKGLKRFGSFKKTSLKRRGSIKGKEINCVVYLLEDKVFNCTFDKNTQGSYLFDSVIRYLDLVEKDYFGLVIRKQASSKKRESPNEVFPTIEWLNPLKKLKKQWSGIGSFELDFRVKYYVSDPNDLQEEYTRYLFVLQCRKDLVSGSLKCPFPLACSLGALVLQSELGDYNPEVHPDGYASAFRLYIHQNADYDKRVEEIHKQLSKQTPGVAEMNFLEKVCRLDHYGASLFNAKDQQGIPLSLSATALGIAVFDKEKKISTFNWNNIRKITFRQKKLHIELKSERDGDRGDHLIKYSLSSMDAREHLWQNCLDYHIFFKRERPESPSKKGIMKRGSKYRFSGRTRKQALQEDQERVRIKGSTSPDYFERIPTNQFPVIKALTTQTVPNGKVAFANDSLLPTMGSGPLPNNHINLKRANTIATHGSRSRDPSPGPLLAVRVDNQRNRKPSDDSRVFRFPSPMPAVSDSDYSGPEEYYDPRQAAVEVALLQYGYMSDELASEGYLPIRLTADSDGRFGFSISKLDSLVIVKRVSEGSPASQSLPALTEGDQIVFINGKPVAELPQDEVILLIKSAGQSESREMILIIRPSDLSRLQPCDIVPDPGDTLAQPVVGEALQRSLYKLRQDSRTGQLLRQFDQLYRRKPGLDMYVCAQPHNMPKNRYKDVFAYDVTRVSLRGEHDYINANYIYMKIPKSENKLFYIAAQGPLRHTCSDFWRMIWEQESTLVVMLTKTSEAGKAKCANYWPQMQKIVAYGPFEIYCYSEEEITINCAKSRHFVVKNLMEKQERRIMQLQYTAWPDHGVPESSDDFLDFLMQVRKERRDMDEPVIVHCSAGVGRTGVLIAVDTAMSTLEALEPVDVLDIIKRMRDQRGMMVQSPAQCQFVADCILKAYRDGYCEFEHMGLGF